jgi:hypothetical protein
MAWVRRIACLDGIQPLPRVMPRAVAETPVGITQAAERQAVAVVPLEREAGR